MRRHERVGCYDDESVAVAAAGVVALVVAVFAVAVAVDGGGAVVCDSFVAMYVYEG